MKDRYRLRQGDAAKGSKEIDGLSLRARPSRSGAMPVADSCTSSRSSTTRIARKACCRKHIARCYAAFGDNQKALEYLAKGVAGHSSFAPVARLYPELKTVIQDPRYQSLLHDRLHLQ